MIKIIANSGREYVVEPGFWLLRTAPDNRIDCFEGASEKTPLVASFPLVNVEAFIVDERKVDMDPVAL
jgi:hypothetical protein